MKLGFGHLKFGPFGCLVGVGQSGSSSSNPSGGRSCQMRVDQKGLAQQGHGKKTQHSQEHYNK